MNSIKANLLGVQFDYGIGRWVMNLSVDSAGVNIQHLIDEYKEKLLDVSMKVHRQKRSLDANAYYWVMLPKLADKLGQSNARLHNILLSRYGEIKTIDGKCIEVEIIETDSAFNEVLEGTVVHLMPTAKITFRDGDFYRTYRMLIGSSEMNTKQMSRLIEGLLTECRENGIPTISDEEAERMCANWRV